MSDTKPSQFKPFIRVTILSIILAFLIIYLGINYHWGDRFKLTPKPSSELTIPEKVEVEDKPKITDNEGTSSVNNFDPKIIIDDNSNSVIDSMNKNQITDACNKLLSKEIDDPLTLELATINCVISNFQETFQNSEKLDDEIIEVSIQELEFKKQCYRRYSQNAAYSVLEKELLIGICVSDRTNASAN